MQQVSEVWKENQLGSVVGESFVEISLELGDPEASEDVVSTDNGSVLFSDTKQITSSVNRNIIPYHTLEKNQWILDGSRRTSPTSDFGDTGYIGDFLSDSAGEFSVTPIVELNFSKVFTGLIPGLVIKWDTVDGNYPIDFWVKPYRNNVQQGGVRYWANKSAETIVFIDMKNYDKITIEILKWSLPYTRPRIAQVILGHTIIYPKTSIMQFEHSQEVDPLSAKLPKMNLRFSIDNKDNEYNPYNDRGYSKYLIERQEIKTRYGYKLNEEIEWIKGGTFYLYNWDAPQNGLVANFEARDILEFLRGTYRKGVYAPLGVSLKTLAELVLSDVVFPERKDRRTPWIIHESLNSIYTKAPLPLATHAECLQMIANAARCILYMDRDGFLRIEPMVLEPTDYVISNFNSFNKPEVALTKPLSSVNVTTYSYSPDAEITEVYTTEMGLEGEYSFYAVFSEPIAINPEPEIIISGGVVKGVTWYTNGCDLTISANGLVSVLIRGKTLNTSETVVTTVANEKGETQEVNNPLVTNNQEALLIGKWVKDLLINRKIISVDWRADPRLDVTDIASLENKYGVSSLLLSSMSFRYNGGIKGRGQGRDLGELA